MRLRLFGVAAFVLLLPLLTACPFVQSTDTVTNVLLWMQRTDKAIDAASELTHRLHCPKCPTHLITADAELAAQDRYLFANELLQKALDGIKAAKAANGNLVLTTTQLASLDTQLNGVKGALAIEGSPGLTSPAVASINEVLAPARKDINAVQAQIQRVKPRSKDATFEITLLPADWQVLDEMRRDVGRAREVLAQRRNSGDVEAQIHE